MWLSSEWPHHPARHSKSVMDTVGCPSHIERVKKYQPLYRGQATWNGCPLIFRGGNGVEEPRKQNNV